MELLKLKGLGNKNESLLNSLNIYTIEDLLMHYPYRYIEYKIDDINNVDEEHAIVVIGTVESASIVRRFKAKLNSLSFRMLSNGKLVNVVIYNRAFMKNNIIIGKTVTVFGKYNIKKNTIVANNIVLCAIKEGKIESRYHLTNGLTNKQITKYIDSALNMNLLVEDYIPDYLNEKYGFVSKSEAIKNIHHPNSLESVKKSKLKLIYEELFIFMYKINYLKLMKTKEANKKPKEVDVKKVQDFLGSLPFELTKDQQSTILEIHKDLISTRRMNRLICGDVGSGKTIVSVVACYENYLSGFQSALMAPTEILALQHYENIKELLSNTNIKVALLLGSTKKKEKEDIYQKLEEGKIDLLIGTHAIISDKVKFKNLGLVVTDEQHRFGVNQRNSLRNKGELPDILYMSATPIPRTYALTIYGDMDISLIKTKPNGRKSIKTIIKNNKDIKEILYMMLDEIKNGHQVYAVTSLIDEGEEDTDLLTATDLKKKLDIAFNHKINVGLLHGKLDKQEKEKVMNDFKEGKTKILVSTTVIEVGVDVKNATEMVIFNAERFGLATLHQLRGRIGRNAYESTCILVGNESENERLKVLEESNDGFYITEKDFEMRREGDLFGVKQSGDMSFKIADVKRDFKILMKAKEDSLIFLEENVRNSFKNNEKYYKIINEIQSLD